MTDKTQKADGGARDMPWEPRVWNGMGVKTWFSLLARNRFHVSPTRIPMALINSVLTFINSGLAFQQHLLFGRKIAACQLADDTRVTVDGHSGRIIVHEAV